MIVCVYDVEHEEKVFSEFRDVPCTFMDYHEGISLDVLDFLWNNPTGNVFYFYGKQSSQARILEDQRLSLHNNIFNQPNQFQQVIDLYHSINGRTETSSE